MIVEIHVAELHKAFYVDPNLVKKTIMTYPLIENYKMNLNNIDELKEVDNIQNVNSLLKQGWVLLSIRETKDQNIYVIGLDRWKKWSADHTVDQEAFSEFFPKKLNQE